MLCSWLGAELCRLLLAAHVTKTEGSDSCRTAGKAGDKCEAHPLQGCWSFP